MIYAIKDKHHYFGCRLRPALYPWEKLAADANVPVERSGYPCFTIAPNLNSEKEVSELLSKIPAAGGTILKPATKAFWGGFSGCFADPVGHIWEIAYNPFAKLGPNGEFQWNGVNSDGTNYSYSPTPS